jgi:NitT/TauT family transport system substrate-binding protein
MRRCRAIILAALLAAMPLAAHAETLKVAVPQKGNWDTSIPDFGIKQGFFAAEGLDLQVTYTEGGATTEQAVIGGSVDVAIGTGLLGIISAYVKGAPVRVMSAEMTGVPDMYFFVPADSAIKSLKDAHGKTVAYSNPGSSSNPVALALLKQAGITDAKPVAAGGIQGIFTQVLSGQLDIGHSVPPIGLKELAEGKIRIIAWGNDVPEIRDQTVRVNVVNLAVLQQRRDAVVRFMRAYDKTIDWAYSGDPKALQYYAEGMNVAPDLAAQAFKYYPKPVMQTGEIKGLGRTLQDALDAKRIPKAMTPDEIKGLFDIVWQPGK